MERCGHERDQQSLVGVEEEAGGVHGKDNREVAGDGGVQKEAWRDDEERDAWGRRQREGEVGARWEVGLRGRTATRREGATPSRRVRGGEADWWFG